MSCFLVPSCHRFGAGALFPERRYLLSLFLSLVGQRADKKENLKAGGLDKQAMLILW